MFRKSVWCKALAVVVALALLLPILACSGEEGAQGPVGPPGPAGAQGEAGAQGPAGEDWNANMFTDPIAIDSGLVSGLPIGLHRDVYMYRGIPYAAPPTGDLRWKPPQAVAPWTGIRECTVFGPACPQIVYPGISQPIESMSEDCLYLNVYTPAKQTTDRLPVVVWLHGGGFYLGAGSADDFTNLARHGAVVVTINYRLGPFGFLAHQFLTQESEHGSSGNYGLLDQVSALQWVKRNIAAFGGNPDNVTILGSSAGGSSVYALMASPLTTGLFHRAIADAGGYLAEGIPSLVDAETQGQALAANLGNVTTLADMRSATVDDIMAAASASEFVTSPVVDGWLLQDQPLAVFQAGEQQDIPLITGCTSADMEGMLAGSVQVATAMSGNPSITSKVYTYVFSYVPAGWKEGNPNGAFHGLHSSYYQGSLMAVRNTNWFKFLNMGVDPQIGWLDEKVAEESMALWISFAEDGDPSIPAYFVWPAYETTPGDDSDQYLDIGDWLQVKSGYSLLSP